MQPSELIRTHIDCSCFTPSHSISFTYDNDGEEKTLLVTLFLNQYTFLKRLYNALRYVCGKKIEYGCFDSWLLDETDTEKVIQILRKMKNEN